MSRLGHAQESLETQAQDAVRAWVERQDEAAACWLVRQYRPLVTSVVRSRFNDASLEEDLVQTVFIKCFRALHRVHEGAPVAPWIARIAKNTCANAWRSRKGNHVVTASEAGIEDWDMLQAPDALAAARQQEESRHLAASLLRQLGKPERRLLWWHYFKGGSAQATGSRFGISAGNVRVRICRVQRSLAGQGRVLRAAAA